MKLLKTANGKQLKISREEWKNIGKKAGWLKTSSDIDDPEVMSELTPEERASIRSHLNELYQERAAIDRKITAVQEEVANENYDYFQTQGIIPFAK